MICIDYSITELIENCNRIILFGAGKMLNVIESGKLSVLSERIAYIIDNGKTDSIYAFGRLIPVYKPDRLLEERDCIVMITSYAHMADMFDQLAGMELPDDIECCCYPFMQKKERHFNIGFESGTDRYSKAGDGIPKQIHTFWFGSADMPDEYKRCIDSWYRICPDYEINIWNRDTYDCNKHPFMRRAVELEAWAYAADYARLDTVYEQGGIYLDSDIEIVKPPEPLRGYDAFFGFFDQGAVDLAAFGGRMSDPLVGSLRSLYDDVKIPDTKEGFTTYFQPFFVMDAFKDAGVKMTGELQT